MANGQITLLLQSDWSVFGRLAAKKERELRRILRPLVMCPSGATRDTTEKRRRCAADLDAALDRLSLIELAIEAGQLDPASTARDRRSDASYFAPARSRATSIRICS